VYQNTFVQTSNEFILGVENNKYRLKNLGTATSQNSLLGTVNYTQDFKYQFTFTSDTANSTPRYGFYNNASNYQYVYVAASVLYFIIVVGGVQSTENDTFTLAVGDTIQYSISNNSNTWSLTVHKNGVLQTSLDIPDIFGDIGTAKIAIGAQSGFQDYIESATITSTKVADHANTSDLAYRVANRWVDWTPTVTWGTADPATNVAQTARYTIIGNTVYFNYSYTADDGNAASSLAITLPVTAKGNNAKIALSALQKVNATWTNAMGYIDDDSAGIAFYNFQTCTNAQACEFIITGFYEIAGEV
jgi:hypothetical protein